MRAPTTGPAVTFRPLRREELPLLHGWLARPHVAEWWGALPTLEELEEEYAPLVDGTDGPHRAFLALHEGEPVGFIQSYTAVACHADGWCVDEHDPGVRGIDQFLADAERLGRGLGTAMVRAFTDLLLADPAVTRVQTDPAPGNARAIRCYEKAGFRAVGEIDTPDGRALLMLRERAPVAEGSPPPPHATR